MANKNKLFGQATIRLDGQFYKSDPGAKLSIGGVTRKPKSGKGWHGFTESDTGSELEAAFAVTSGLSLASINEADDVTISFECDTGQVYVIPNGWSAEPAALTDGEGTSSFTFNGPPAEELI